MERKTVYEDPNLRLEFVKDGRYLHETWWGRTPGETFARLLGIIVEKLNDFKADGLPLDAREHKGLGPDSQKLAAEKIGDYAREHGKLKEAIIVPKDVFRSFQLKITQRNWRKRRLLLKPDFLMLSKQQKSGLELNVNA